MQDVIDSYDPDVLYFDDNAQFDFDAGGRWAPDLGVWLGIPDLAPQIMAYYYKQEYEDAQRPAGSGLESEDCFEPIWGTLTRDFEAAMEDKLQESPWQRGRVHRHAWHYDRSIF